MLLWAGLHGYYEAAVASHTYTVSSRFARTIKIDRQVCLSAGPGSRKRFPQFKRFSGEDPDSGAPTVPSYSYFYTLSVSSIHPLRSLRILRAHCVTCYARNQYAINKADNRGQKFVVRLGVFAGKWFDLGKSIARPRAMLIISLLFISLLLNRLDAIQVCDATAAP